MSIFSKIDELQILPNKRKLVETIVVSSVSILLYVATTILYIIVSCKNGTTDLSDCKLVISILEIIINLASIIVCLIATIVSNIFIANCIKGIERIEQANVTLINEIGFPDLQSKVKRTNRFLKAVKIAFSVCFVCYIVCNIVFTVLTQTPLVNIINIIVSSVSALISIILGLISTLSLFAVGNYTRVSLLALKKINQNMLDKYNDLLITQSYEK